MLNFAKNLLLFCIFQVFSKKMLKMKILTTCTQSLVEIYNRYLKKTITTKNMLFYNLVSCRIKNNHNPLFFFHNPLLLWNNFQNFSRRNFFNFFFSLISFHKNYCNTLMRTVNTWKHNCLLCVIQVLNSYQRGVSAREGECLGREREREREEMKTIIFFWFWSLGDNNNNNKNKNIQWKQRTKSLIEHTFISPLYFSRR